MKEDDLKQPDAARAAAAERKASAPRSRPLPPAAERALAEAAERRKAYQAREDAMPRELGGRRKGKEPSRYGDWEKGGLAVDF